MEEKKNTLYENAVSNFILSILPVLASTSAKR